MRKFTEQFVIPYADMFYGDADFIFHCQKAPTPALMSIVKRNMRGSGTNNANDQKVFIKST